MTERNRAAHHFSLAIEELLRAGAETIAQMRELGDRASRGGEAAPLERAFRRMADSAAGWIAGGEGEVLESLRAALRREVIRWDARAADDPAALRVRDLCQALLDVFGDEEDESSAV